MAGRYDYSLNLSPGALAPAAPSADEQKRRKQADLLHFLGSMAPVAGGALGMGIGALAGGPMGAMVGGGLGSAAGQLAGGGLDYAGSSETQQDDTNRQAANQKRNDLLSVLMSMRR